MVILPKAAQKTHQRQNRALAHLQLLPDNLAALDRLFPPLARKVALAMWYSYWRTLKQAGQLFPWPRAIATATINSHFFTTQDPP